MRTVLREAKTFLKRTLPKSSRLRATAQYVDEIADLAFHTLAASHPSLIQPKPQALFISLTANCNLKCLACKYGRDFMPGHRLPFSIGGPLLDDAREFGVRNVRLYGGEPLIHPELADYVRRTVANGMGVQLTTNGLLLGKQIDRLYEAGLRRASLGFYGVGDAYDAYVQSKGAFRAVEKSVASVRQRYGADRLGLHLDWLLMRPTSRPESVQATLEFARRYDMAIFVNLIHYSLPYFATDDETGDLSFTEADRGRLDEVVGVLIEEKRKHPKMFRNSEAGLRSIPDWLILGPEMRLPCRSYDLLWVGPDGTVQMCYVTFRMGNLHEKRLKDMVGTDQHKGFARDAFQLNCPNCHCGYDRRVRSHAPSRARYSA